MFENLKSWMLHKEFAKDARPYGRHSSGTNALQSVCILFDGTDEDERKIVHKFKKKLSPDSKRTVKSLAFINNSLPLDNIDYAAYYLKQIKWFGLPFGEKVEEFLQYNYDILIVLCKKMLPHYEFIIAHSKAQFAIGPSIEKASKYFDITVQMEGNDTTDQLILKIIEAIDKISIK